MHCPNCGQQQISVEIKFCSRCGFPMGLISELLANGGTPPQFATAVKKKFWVKKNGVLLSIMIGMSFWFLAALSDVVGFGRGEDFFGIAGFFLMIIGPMASLLFLESSKNAAIPNHTPVYMPNAGVEALSGQQSIPVEQYVNPGHWRVPETDELVRQGSVTDSTTKPLEKDS